MTSSILKGFLTIPRLILWPIDKLMTFFHCLLLRATSGKLAIVYNPAYNAFWLPINLYLRGTSFVYRELFTPRPILVLITVPLILVFDIFRVILPNPDQSDKEKKARILESWPYSIDEIKNRPIKYGNLLTGNHCPQCRKPVADHWEVCQYCGEKLEGCPYCQKLISTSATQCAHCGRVIPEKVGMIGQCPMCGDMLNPEWKRCARCGEPVNNSLQPVGNTL